MAFFRPTFDFIRQMWHALDTASALRHGASVSERARLYCAAPPTQQVSAGQ